MTTRIFLYLYLLFQLLESIQIINVTSPIDLTYIFIQLPPQAILNDINTDSMTYYIDPKNSSHKNLWFGMDYYWFSFSGNERCIKNGIFTQQWTQYNNQLPFDIQCDENGKDDDELYGNTMCTSPITNDIFTCWIYNYKKRTVMGTNLECRIYFAQNNTLSSIIQIATDYDKYSFTTTNPICFNDSYFIPYLITINGSSFNSTNYVYGTLLDLNGNVVYNKIDLGISYSYWIAYNYYIPLHTIKGSKDFDVKTVNPNASELVVINFRVSDSWNNDYTNITGIYMYYTNINDTKCPINVYLFNESIARIHMYNSAYYFYLANTVLNWKNDCCYIAIYQSCVDDYGFVSNIYALITDIYGNQIFPNFEHMLLLANRTGRFKANVIDLPMLSNSSRHYFMVTFGNKSEDMYYGYVSNTSTCSIYYLQYNYNEKQYNLEHVGYFNMASLVNQPHSTEIYWENVNVYNLPETNYLFISWVEGRDPNIEATHEYYLYGQTWQIN